jgi:hypothetical protein
MGITWYNWYTVRNCIVLKPPCTDISLFSRVYRHIRSVSGVKIRGRRSVRPPNEDVCRLQYSRAR